MHMPANESSFTPPPAGTHIAICYRLIDLGTQPQPWQGETKYQRKILVSWELPDERMDDGRPFTISQRYTYSSSEKAKLRKDLEGWRGKAFTDADFGPGGFDIKNILGKPCMLSIVHTSKEGKTYANIASVSGVPKAIAAAPPKQINETTYLSLEHTNYDPVTFEKLADGLKTTIKASPEWQHLNSVSRNGTGSGSDYETRGYDEQNPPPPRDSLDDQIPF